MQVVYRRAGDRRGTVEVKLDPTEAPSNEDALGSFQVDLEQKWGHITLVWTKTNLIAYFNGKEVDNVKCGYPGSSKATVYGKFCSLLATYTGITILEGVVESSDVANIVLACFDNLPVLENKEISNLPEELPLPSSPTKMT